MAVTSSPRLGITRWSLATDPFRRAQLDADHGLIDSLAAIYGQGLINDRPAAGIAGRYYYATDQGRHYYDDGAAWQDVGLRDHGALTGLGDDDHTQYALADGTRGSFAAPNHSHAASAITSGFLNIARIPVAQPGASSDQLVVRADDPRLVQSIVKVADVNLSVNGATNEILVTGIPDNYSRLTCALRFSDPGNVQAIGMRLNGVNSPTGYRYAQRINNYAYAKTTGADSIAFTVGNQVSGPGWVVAEVDTVHGQVSMQGMYGDDLFNVVGRLNGFNNPITSLSFVAPGAAFPTDSRLTVHGYVR